MEDIFKEITKGCLVKAVLIAIFLIAFIYFVIIKQLWGMNLKSYNLNDKAGVTTLQQDAEEGDRNAQYWLGKAYYYGEGMVEKNEKKGLDLLHQAKEKKSDDAENLLNCIQAENFGTLECQTKEEKESSASSLIKK